MEELSDAMVEHAVIMPAKIDPHLLGSIHLPTEISFLCVPSHVLTYNVRSRMIFVKQVSN